ncbi:MAG: SH3 domain-containing protein [Candidatus Sericytochromatia bacterium]
MNVITRENEQAMLHEHYNNANRFFQAGDYTSALKELQEALRYAEDDKQIAHIEQTMRTVKEAMQPQAAAPTETSNAPAAAGASPLGGLAGNNKLLLLTILVGLICLTPIVMKCIEIFSQPSVGQTEQAAAPASPATETNAETASGTPSGENAPSATPDVIVAAETEPGGTDTPAVAAQSTVIGNSVNVRAEASTRGASVARLGNGESVTVLEANAIQADGYTWSKIQTAGGATGFVASQFLQAAAPAAAAPVSPAAPVEGAADGTLVTETPAAETPAGPTRAVAGTGVALRAEPTTGGALLTTLSPSQITVLQDKAVTADGLVWTKIRTSGGTEGWVADKFLGN